MKFLAGGLGFLVILSCTAFIFMYAGWYDVAATSPHWKVTAWFLGEVRDRSIARQSEGIQVPAAKDPKWFRTGFTEYHAMCRLCHGAPGYPQTEIAQGLNPKPPNLASKAVQGRKESEIYWVVKKGIKMTGMPSFGPTHGEEELWAIVGFVKRMSDLQPKQYEAMASEAERGKEKEGHHHHNSRKH